MTVLFHATIAAALALPLGVAGADLSFEREGAFPLTIPNENANKPDDVPVVVEQEECDPMEKFYAPDCCPMKDPSFISFCQSLFDRPHYSSTGMLEAHEPWIGDYGIADSIPHKEKDEKENEEAVEETAVEAETEAEKDTPEVIVVPGTPSQFVPPVQHEEAVVQQDDCSTEEKFYAPVCCPLKNEHFKSFCEGLLGRPHN